MYAYGAQNAHAQNISARSAAHEKPVSNSENLEWAPAVGSILNPFYPILVLPRP